MWIGNGSKSFKVYTHDTLYTWFSWSEMMRRWQRPAIPSGAVIPEMMQFAIENGHWKWIIPGKMVVFHSYVKLPDGIFSDYIVNVKQNKVPLRNYFLLSQCPFRVLGYVSFKEWIFLQSVRHIWDPYGDGWSGITHRVLAPQNRISSLAGHVFNKPKYTY